MELEHLDPPSVVAEKNARSGFGRWNRAFTKLRVLEQDSYAKIVMLDADMMVVRNIDGLLELPHMSAVAAGHGLHPDWVDLNSGLMVIEPSAERFVRAADLLASLDEDRLGGYVAFGDQDVFQMLQPNWRDEVGLHLPEKFNLFQECIAPYSRSGLVPEGKAAVIHFELSPKPWDYTARDWLSASRRAVRYRSTAELRAIRRYRELLDREGL